MYPLVGLNLPPIEVTKLSLYCPSPGIYEKSDLKAKMLFSKGKHYVAAVRKISARGHCARTVQSHFFLIYGTHYL